MSNLYKKLLMSLMIVGSFGVVASEPVTQEVEQQTVENLVELVETVDQQELKDISEEEKLNQLLDNNASKDPAAGCDRHPFCG